jgi:ketosteroid isomerase-like protein
MAALPPVALLGIMLFGVSGACRSKDGASNDSRAPTAISPADEAKIRSADSTFVAAANAADVAGILAVYASDAALLAPNLPPQKGHDAIKAFWGGLLDAYTVRFEVVSDTIEGRGDLAYNQGHYRFTAVPKAKGVPGVADEGKFVEILKKQPDGSWKYVVDMYSSNLALQH